MVHCEVSFFEIYKGQPLFSEVEQYMREEGFELIDLRSLCRYPLLDNPFDSSQDWLGWSDAVFFRRLNGASDWRDRMVQSIIALMIYDKPSLAAWLVSDLNGTPAELYSKVMNVPNTVESVTY